MPFDIAVASPADAPAVSDIHLRAMDANLLTHAQFPTPAALRGFHACLAANTAQHARDADKGVLVARDAASRRIASFLKWLVCDPAAPPPAAEADDAWPPGARVDVLASYAALTEQLRRDVMGAAPYYHVTYLCTDPAWSGRGAASALLRRLLEQAAAAGVAVILEATMEGVSLYRKMGFRVAREIHMMLPPRGADEPTEPYEERCMLWTPPGRDGC